MFSLRKIAVENHEKPHQTNVTRLNERQKRLYLPAKPQTTNKATSAYEPHLRPAPNHPNQSHNRTQNQPPTTNPHPKSRNRTQKTRNPPPKHRKPNPPNNRGQNIWRLTRKIFYTTERLRKIQKEFQTKNNITMGHVTVGKILTTRGYG